MSKAIKRALCKPVWLRGLRLCSREFHSLKKLLEQVPVKTSKRITVCGQQSRNQNVGIKNSSVSH